MGAQAATVATRVMTRCPVEEKDVFTGHRMRVAEREAIVEPRAFRCAACGEIHRWDAASAWSEARPRV